MGEIRGRRLILMAAIIVAMVFCAVFLSSCAKNGLEINDIPLITLAPVTQDNGDELLQAVSPTKECYETPSPTASETHSPSSTSTKTPSPTETPTQSPTQAPSPTETPTPSPTPGSTAEPSTVPTPTPGSTAEPSTVPTPAPTETPLIMPAQSVKIVSYNIDGLNPVEPRKEGMMKVLMSCDADSIGLQEVMGDWNDYLKAQMEKNGYGRIGLDAGGYEESVHGYFATFIFYKKAKFNVIDSGMFWMSDTPEIKSFGADTVHCYRTCTWVILEDKVTGFRYVHMNLHLDWEDTEVTKKQAAMIRNLAVRFENMGYPVFVTGDFNSKENTPEYKVMLEAESIGDAKYLAEISSEAHTFPNYGAFPVNKMYTLDYCFVTKNVINVKQYRVLEDKPTGVDLSDHYGIFITADVSSCTLKTKEDNMPKFGDLAVNFVLTGPAKGDLTFKAAVDKIGNTAKYYKIEIYNSSKELVFSRDNVNGNILAADAPINFSVTLRNLPTGSISIRVIPVGFFGVWGESYYYNTVIPDYDDAVFTPDIMDIKLDDDGKIRDFSGNSLKIEQIGNVGRENIGDSRFMVFTGNGNYKIPGVADFYGQISEGFSLETKFVTGGDVQRKQGYVSNFQSGGFGLEIVGGKMCYSLYIGGGYKTVSADVSTNSEYHVIMVYDTSCMYLFVNGELAGSLKVGGTLTFPNVSKSKYLCIGADSDATGNGECNAQCKIEFVKMYSDTITEKMAKNITSHSKQE